MAELIFLIIAMLGSFIVGSLYNKKKQASQLSKSQRKVTETVPLGTEIAKKALTEPLHNINASFHKVGEARNAEARIAEEARISEEERIALEARITEITRRTKAAKIAKETRIAEEERISEEGRIALEARITEITRRTKAAKIAKETRIAEEERIAEEARITEEARIAEEERIAEETRIALIESIVVDDKQTPFMQLIPDFYYKVSNDLVGHMADDLMAYYQSNIEVSGSFKFQNGTIYLRKSSRLTSTKDIKWLGKNRNSYRIFNWDDSRVREIITKSLGEEGYLLDLDSEGPTLGNLEVIGNYRHTPNDRINNQYQSSTEKAFFRSARQTIESEGKLLSEGSKIDITEFLRMKEVIPTGEQGKAIYSANDCIIDGAAGTGKSTTIIQKLKVLTRENPANASKVLLITKNNDAIKSFDNLLSSLNIQGVKLTTYKNLINENQFQDNELEEVRLTVDDIVNELLNIDKVDTPKLLKSRQVRALINYYKENKNLLLKQKSILKDGQNEIRIKAKNQLEEMIIHECKAQLLSSNYLEQKLNEDSLDSFKKSIRFEAPNFIIEVDLLSTHILQSTLREEERYLNNISENEITNALNSMFSDQKINIENTLRQKGLELIGKIKEPYNKAHGNIKRSINKIQDAQKKTKANIEANVTTKEFWLELNIHEADLALNYFLKAYLQTAKYELTILDEAQDAPLAILKYVKLLSRSVNFVGDEAQNQDASALGKWENIQDKLPSYFGKLEEFRLSHNFRQAAELAQASHNMRGQILNRPLTNIMTEYFSHQKGFEKPAFIHAQSDAVFVKLIREKIEYIVNYFSQKTPIVFLYTDELTKKRVQKLCESNHIAIEYGFNIASVADICFVPLENAAGMEFPLILTNFEPETSIEVIYAAFSRANFGAMNISKESFKSHKKINELNVANVVTL